MGEPVEAVVHPPRVLKVAPGEAAEVWGDCLDHGYIRVGWDKVGDLRAYATKEELCLRLSEAYLDRYREPIHHHTPGQRPVGFSPTSTG